MITSFLLGVNKTSITSKKKEGTLTSEQGMGRKGSVVIEKQREWQTGGQKTLPSIDVCVLLLRIPFSTISKLDIRARLFNTAICVNQGFNYLNND